jgi:hypothetical protein
MYGNIHKIYQNGSSYFRHTQRLFFLFPHINYIYCMLSYRQLCLILFAGHKHFYSIFFSVIVCCHGYIWAFFLLSVQYYCCLQLPFKRSWDCQGFLSPEDMLQFLAQLHYLPQKNCSEGPIHPWFHQ